MRGILLSGAIACALSGCTFAELDSINRKFNPSAGDSRLIDIKQRAIYSVRTPVIDPFEKTPITYTDSHGKTQVLHRNVVCAEPSPDALQSTAAALGGNVSSEQLQAALSGAGSLSGTGASVGLRTQAITLLRDAYYRICEGYAGGAMDDIAFNVLQQRFQNHMVALLAVEQLTGATVAAQATTTTNAASDAGANLGALLDENGAAADEIAALQLQQDAVALQRDAVDDQQSDTFKSLDSRVNALQIQIDERKDALEKLQNAISIAAGQTPDSSASGSAQLGEQKITGGGELPAHVSAAVTAITLNTLNQDYGLQLCVELARETFTKAPAAAIALREDRQRMLMGLQPRRSVGESIQALNVSGMMVEYCNNRLQADARTHATTAEMRDSRIHQINAIINNLSRGKIDTTQAAALLKALNETVPNSPENVFQPDFSALTGKSCGVGTVPSADGTQCIPG